MSNLIRIDELFLRQHANLCPDDECYFLLEYIAHSRLDSSAGNQLIRNFKKSLDRKDRPEWRYKTLAIDQVARMLMPLLPLVIDFSTTTLIPIPPSKNRGNPLYDDRVLQVLKLACPADADIQESIVCREDRDAGHLSTSFRPDVDDLLLNYEWIPGVRPLREIVVLFDDVISAGNHFAACRRMILSKHPGRRVIGVFIARRSVS